MVAARSVRRRARGRNPSQVSWRWSALTRSTRSSDGSGFVDGQRVLACRVWCESPDLRGDPADGIATAASSAAICAAELVGSAAMTAPSRARWVGRLMRPPARRPSPAGLRQLGRLGRRVATANIASATIASAPSTSRIVHGKPEGSWTAGLAGCWVGVGGCRPGLSRGRVLLGLGLGLGGRVQGAPASAVGERPQRRRGRDPAGGEMTRVLKTLHRRPGAGAVTAVSPAGREPGARKAALQPPDRVSGLDRARARQQAAGSEPVAGMGADDPVDRQPVGPLKTLPPPPGSAGRTGRRPGRARTRGW